MGVCAAAYAVRSEMRDRKPVSPALPADSTTTKRGKTSASLGPEIQARIGSQLRAYYAGLIEPTPDRFVELLRQLDKPGDKGSSE
jgi:Anti-sigma factor NepR